MPGVKPGEVNETLKSLLRINKATQKEGVPNGGATITRNLDAGFISVTAIFPVEEIETSEGTIIKAIDFVETEQPVTNSSGTIQL
jgi:hypothetical protein